MPVTINQRPIEPNFHIPIRVVLSILCVLIFFYSLISIIPDYDKIGLYFHTFALVLQVILLSTFILGVLSAVEPRLDRLHKFRELVIINLFLRLAEYIIVRFIQNHWDADRAKIFAPIIISSFIMWLLATHLIYALEDQALELQMHTRIPDLPTYSEVQSQIKQQPASSVSVPLETSNESRPLTESQRDSSRNPSYELQANSHGYNTLPPAYRP